MRHLAQAGACGEALLAAKHLHCGICQRTKAPSAPRPTKVTTARRFNDRLLIDIVYLHTLLSPVDDETTYHLVEYLDNCSEPAG